MVEDFRKVGERVRNWGRWGDDDERGTVNLITPECLVAATQLVRQGKVFDLELDGTDRAKAEADLKAMCRKLLANPVIENYRIEREPAA